MKVLSSHNLSNATYEQAFSIIYLGVRINLLLAIWCSPLLSALAVVDDPLTSWPFFLALSTLCAPALATICDVFRQFTDEGDVAVFRAVATTWRRHWRRATAVWMCTGLALGIVVIDLLVVLGSPLEGALVPMLVTIGVVVVSVGTSVIVLSVEEPARGLRRTCAAASWLSARRWYLAVLNVVVLGVLAGAVVLQPVVGVLVAPAPLLYVVWANTRFVLEPVRAARAGLRQDTA